MTIHPTATPTAAKDLALINLRVVSMTVTVILVVLIAARINSVSVKTSTRSRYQI